MEDASEELLERWLPFFGTTFEPDETGQVTDFLQLEIAREDAAEVAYYTKFPAALADLMAEVVVGLSYHEDPCIVFVWPWQNGRLWWRLFSAMNPQCPLCPEPFLKLTDYWWDELPNWDNITEEVKRDVYTSRVDRVRDEVCLFFMWLEATDGWGRPSKEEAEAQEKRHYLKRLCQLYNIIQAKGQIAPDGIVGKNDRDGRVALKILHLLGLYSGYDKVRNDLTPEAESIIANYDLTAKNITP